MGKYKLNGAVSTAMSSQDELQKLRTDIEQKNLLIAAYVKELKRHQVDITSLNAQVRPSTGTFSESALQDVNVGPLLRLYESRLSELEQSNDRLTQLMEPLREDATILSNENDRLLAQQHQLREKEARLLEFERSTGVGFNNSDKQEYEEKLEVLLRENELSHDQLQLMEEELKNYTAHTTNLETKLHTLQLEAQ